MEKNIGKEFGGERPLYRKKDLYLEDVVIRPGESGLKETANITAVKCRFEGKYPLWECDGFVVKDSILTVGARSGLWYSRGGELYNTIIDAPQTFRRMTGIKMRDCWIPGGSETFWDCSDIDVKDCQIERADYVFMHCENIVLENVKLQGNYGFQYAKNVVIKNCILNSKDSFWEAENVEVYDSVINGEYLAWYSKNLKLVRCHITETQPLCYCEGLVMEDCTFGSDCDLAFEYSDVEATVKGHVVSIKNPRSGHIHVGSVGEIIIDENIKAPGDCQITSDK